MKDYYGLLEVAPTASQDEVKRAFRLQIARYHPDKVQHLGREFQAMAAERAAELTEAYRILSDQAHRAEYDRSRMAGAPAAPPSSASPPPPVPHSPPPDAPAPDVPPAGGASKGEPFSQERATRDEYVREAMLGRFKQAFALAMGTDYDESPARGFDLAFAPKAKLFGRGRGPRLVGRFVAHVDTAAVAATWAHVSRLHLASSDEVCVFLMGPAMAPRRELEEAIFAQRRKARGAGPKVSLIPVDNRNWDAYVPVDAPAQVKNLLARLRGGT